MTEKSQEKAVPEADEQKPVQPTVLEKIKQLGQTNVPQL